MNNLYVIKSLIIECDEILKFLKNEHLTLNNGLNNLKETLSQHYKNRYSDMEGELSKKLGLEKSRLTNEFQNKIKIETTPFQIKLNEIRKEIDRNLKNKNDVLSKELEPIQYLYTLICEVYNKLEELHLGTEGREMVKAKEIAMFSEQEIKDLLIYAKECSDIILDLKWENLSLQLINRNLLFVVDKLPVHIKENKNLYDIAKVLNLLILIILLMFYGNFFIGAIIGLTGFYTIKNLFKGRKLDNNKSWVLSVGEILPDIQNKIIADIDKKYNLENFYLQLKNTESQIEKIKSKINFDMNKELNTLIKNFKESEHSKILEISEFLKADLNEKFLKISEIQTVLSSRFESTLWVSDIKNSLSKEFEKMNKFNIEVENDLLDLKLNNFHLGNDVEFEDVKYFVDLDFKSILFVYSGERMTMRNLMKYIGVQYCSRLKGNLLKINILDPESYGEGLSELVYDTLDFGQFYSDVEVSHQIDYQLSKFRTDVKSVFAGFDSILEYNAFKNSKKSQPYPYTLNLIQNISIFSKMQTFKQLLQTEKSGIINLILIPEEIMGEYQNSIKDSEVKRVEFIDFMSLFGGIFNSSGEDYIEITKWNITEKEGEDSGKGKLEYIQNYLNNFKKDIDPLLTNLDVGCDYQPLRMNPYTVAKELIESNKKDNMFKCMYLSSEDFRDLGHKISLNIKRSQQMIFFFDDFVNHVVPRDKEFNFDCVKGLDMYFGYRDGDTEKAESIPLNGETIHYFMGGRSGMGKSNTLNVGINTLIRQYSPDDLNIYYLDFKTIEGMKYMRNPTPHFKCISVTTDPYYLVSLFDFLIKELQYRQKELLPKYNAGKLADIKKKGIKVPEIVIIIDEFTEALKSEDDRVKEKIIASSDTIAGLGRASGVHLFYTSQELSSKIPDRMLGQLSGRLCLPVSKAEESKLILMNTRAADSDFGVMGNLLFNNRNGDEKFNIKFKVPLIEPEDMELNLKYVNSLCKDKWALECVLFDEKDEKKEKQLKEFLNKYASKLKSHRKIPLGGNAKFSIKENFVGVEVMPEENNNILILSQSKRRRIELTNTIIESLAYMYGDQTQLFILRGNKDYLSYDYTQLYKDKFYKIMILDSFESFIDIMRGSKLKILEDDLLNFGKDYDKEPNFNMWHQYKEFNAVWDNFKNNKNDSIKSFLPHFFNAVRPYVKKVVLLAEGGDEIEGIGLNNYDTIQNAGQLVKYAPYYEVLNVWNMSKKQSFTKLNTYFKHQLIGSLNDSDIMDYKFMKDSANTCGGYFNVLIPEISFKFKLFKIEGITDDEAIDNDINFS